MNAALAAGLGPHTADGGGCSAVYVLCEQMATLALEAHPDAPRLVKALLEASGAQGHGLGQCDRTGRTIFDIEEKVIFRVWRQWMVETDALYLCEQVGGSCLAMALNVLAEAGVGTGRAGSNKLRMSWGATSGNMGQGSEGAGARLRFPGAVANAGGGNTGRDIVSARGSSRSAGTTGPDDGTRRDREMERERNRDKDAERDSRGRRRSSSSSATSSFAHQSEPHASTDQNRENGADSGMGASTTTGAYKRINSNGVMSGNASGVAALSTSQRRQPFPFPGLGNSSGENEF